MGGTDSRPPVVATVAIVVVLSTIAYVPLAGATHTGALPSDQVFTAKDGVDAWERAMLPLRADMTDARWTVPNALWTLEDEAGNTKDLNKDPVGVFTVGTTVELTFDDARAQTTNLADEQVTVVAAHIEEDENVEVDDATTFSGALDLLTEENANANASFEEVARTSLAGDGTATFTHTVDQSGHYVYFVATNETGKQGLVVDTEGNVSVDGNVTVVGVEQVVVEQTQADVDVQTSVVRGRTITFDADSRLSGSDIKHVVVVYDATTFEDQQFTLSIDESLSRDFDVANNSTLEHPIAVVNGVGRLDDDLSVLGVDVSDGRVARQVGVGTIFDFVAAKTDQPRPQNLSTDDVVLHASTTGEVGGVTASIEVETFANWTADRDYRWLYAAVGSNSQELSTDEGEILVRAAPPPSPPPPRPPAAGRAAPPAPRVQVSTVGTNRAQVQVTDARANTAVAVSIPAIDVAEQAGGAIGGIRLTPNRDTSFDVSVTASPDPPSGTPPLQTAGPTQPVTYFDIQHTVPDDDIADVTFEIRVSKARLAALGSDPANVAMYRYANGWTELPTDLVAETTQFYVYDVTAPGLSAFAIGVKSPEIGVVRASLDRTTLTVDGTARVTATLENTGAGRGTFQAALTVDGTVVETQNVTLLPGESATVTFDRTFDRAGVFDIAVSGTSAGTLTVEAAETPTPTARPTAPPTASPTAAPTPAAVAPGSPTPAAPAFPIREPGALGLSVIVLIVALALIAALVIIYRRRQGV